MAIPNEFIDELLAQIDIVDIIGSRLPLKRKGKEYSACCPFHDERTASFFVSPAKQFYHCFGCNAHGTAISFLINYDRLEFRDAIEILAQRAGLSIPADENGIPRRNQSEHDALYSTLASASQFFKETLLKNQQALDYLSQRGIDQRTRDLFGLGYAPNHYHALSQELGKTSQQQKLLERSGLLSQNDRGQAYDKFRNRLIFPIADRRGRTIAFGGRLISADNGPKYLNSPETPIFHKGKELYGLWHVRQANQRLQRLVVVEGYMDVLALFQYGLPYGVATLGTATTSDHVELAFRNADSIYFCFDGDAPGRKAAWRALEATLPRLKEERQAHFLFLPEHEDPDSILRQEGKERFEDRLQQASPLSHFFFETLSSDVALQTLDGKARLFERARPLLARIPDSAFSDLMLQHLKGLTGLQLKPAHKDQAHSSRPTPSKNQRTLAPKSIVQSILTLLIQNPSLCLSVTLLPALTQLRQPGIPILFEIFDLVRQRPSIQTGALLEHFQSRSEYPHLCVLATETILGSSTQWQQILQNAITKLERQFLQQRIQDLIVKQKREPLDLADKYELRELLRAQATQNQ